MKIFDEPRPRAARPVSIRDPLVSFGLSAPFTAGQAKKSQRVASAMSELVPFAPRPATKRTSKDFALVPCVDGSELARTIFTSQRWSVQPCVRPVGAVHMTAGHNALRGSGPGQKPAFDDALAHVGCPDRRIDRLCVTCCSPSQPSHHARCPARSHSRRKGDGFFVALALGHHRPGHPGELVGERNRGNLRRAPGQQ